MVSSAQNKISLLSLPKSVSFLEHAKFGMQRMLPNKYGLITFEALRNLHLGISKMLKETLVTYLSSDTILTDPGRAKLGEAIDTGAKG